MPSIVEYIERKKRSIDKIVDQTFFRLKESTESVNAYHPITSYSDSQLLSLRFTRHAPTLAPVIAPGQDIPPSRPQMTLNEDQFTSMKIGKSIVWKEKDFELMRKMQMMLSAGGPANSEAAQALENYYFGQIADLVPAIYNTTLKNSFRVALTGACTYQDPLSKYQVALDYTSGLNANQFPAALTSTARWNQPTQAACTPLANIETHATNMYNLVGMWPNIRMRWTVLRYIADSNEAKIAWMRKTGNSTSGTPDVTGMYLSDEQTISMVAERLRGGSVTVFDAMYSEEAADGVVTDKYYISDSVNSSDYYILEYPNYIERAFVPTVEKDFAPGVYTISERTSYAPRVERSVAVAANVVACFDPRLLAARKVV